MATATLAYTPIKLAPSEANPDGSIIHRPLAVAKILARSGRSRLMIVLPDSGADTCVFPLSLAMLLGIDLLKLPRSITTGVGGQANPTYHAELTIDIGQGLLFTTQAGFTTGMDAIGIGLLGQEGFFENFNVEFRHAEKIFRIASR